MADVIRTKAQILALLADNSTGEISPQDLRDMMVSLMGVYGMIIDAANATAQTVVSGVAEKQMNWTADGLSVGMTPDYANGDLQVDNTGVYLIIGKASLRASVSNVVIQSHIRVDDVQQDAGYHRKMASAGDQGSASMFSILSLNAAEKLSLWIEADVNCDIVVEHSELIAVRIG